MTEPELQRLMKHVRQALWSFRGDPEWEDLLSEGYLGLWEAVRRPPATCSLATAVSRRARWRALDWLSRRQRREGICRMVPLAEWQGESDDPARAAERRLIWRDVLERAAPRQRAYLIGHYAEGRSVAEVARRCGVIPATVHDGLRGALAMARRRWL